MNIPGRLLESMQGLQGFDQLSFLAAHENRSVISIRLNTGKCTVQRFEGIPLSPVPWCSTGYYLEERPAFTFDPLFHAGCYYVQEASSMFLEQAIRQLTDNSAPLKVLDLSAAPGGKSTHLHSLLSAGSLLVSNDVIRSRALILKQNIIKWGSGNVVVTSNDPQHFSRLSGFFDVMVVDAPCSGSGLFRKDAEAINEWSDDNVMLCQGRQKRILADAMPALRDGGLLVYSTCSYSAEENEIIADWLLEEQSMTALPLKVPAEWGIVQTVSGKGGIGYRFYPDKVRGEGFYLACFQNTKAAGRKKSRISAPEKLSAKETAVVSAWIKEGDHLFMKHGSSVLAVPQPMIESLPEIQSCLFIQYAGTLVGELIRDKFVPDHALALSQLVADTIPRVEVSLEEAIRYLQRADISISSSEKGWQLVSFKGNPLGWINVLSGRINNYYPKEMRILKQ